MKKIWQSTAEVALRNRCGIHATASKHKASAEVQKMRHSKERRVNASGSTGRSEAAREVVHQEKRGCEN
eukprot:564565-Pelagomonas_calceolata.AAC.1